MASIAEGEFKILTRDDLGQDSAVAGTTSDRPDVCLEDGKSLSRHIWGICTQLYCLFSGDSLPIRFHYSFDNALIGTPLWDVDPYYAGKNTFVVITKGKTIYRLLKIMTHHSILL